MLNCIFPVYGTCQACNDCERASHRMGDWTGEGSKHCERAYASHQENKHFDHPMHFDFDSSLISSVRLRTPKSYPLRTLLMLINRANNIYSSRNRLEMMRTRQPCHDSWPCSPPLTPCLLLLRRYFAVTLLLQTALYPPFFSFYIIIWFLHQHLLLFFCFF